MKNTLILENIKCHGCSNTIKNTLLKIEGITEVEIMPNTQTVTVQGTAPKEIILKKLAQLGYPEKGSNDLLKKAKSYVSCAIGKLS